MQKRSGKLVHTVALFTIVACSAFFTTNLKTAFSTEPRDSCETVTNLSDEGKLNSEGEVIQVATNPLIMAENETSQPAKPEQKLGQCEARNVKNGDIATNGMPCNRGTACLFAGKQCFYNNVFGHCATVPSTTDGACQCRCIP